MGVEWEPKTLKEPRILDGADRLHSRKRLEERKRGTSARRCASRYEGLLQDHVARCWLSVGVSRWG